MLAPARLPGRLSFSPDGALLTAGAAIIDVRSGRVLRVFRGQLSSVTAVAFAPDGGLLATASEDGTVRVWDTGRWAVRRALTHPGHELSEVAFSPDGSRLAAKSDAAVLLWDTVTWAGPPS